MRYINLNDIEFTDDFDWKTESKKLQDKLAKAKTHKAKAKILDESPLWKKLFVPLSKLSHGKCWYSEALEVMSDRDVDHFRPKNEAKNINGIPRADEEGYWWLAYDFENFRFSSQYSNERRKDKFKSDKPTGGKGSFFPLFEGSIVAKKKPNLKDEDIMLLDPCDENDPPLLTFDSTGKAIPNAQAILEDRDRLRVETSIQLYHLDNSTLEELRAKVWGFCQRMIDEIRTISNDPDGIGTFGRNRVFFLKDEIRKLTRRSEELSAVAIACCEENGLSMLAERR